MTDVGRKQLDENGPAGLGIRGHTLAWGGTMLLAIILFVVELSCRNQNVWDGWQESSELRRPAYAESIHLANLFRTRANTWSNVSYVLVGLYGVAYAWSDMSRGSLGPSGYVVKTPAMSFVFGFACCVLGLGSGLFHASLTRWGQQVDVAAMYPPQLAFVAMQLGRRYPVIGGRRSWTSTPTWPILIAVVFVTSVLLYQYKWVMSSARVMSTLFLVLSAFVILDAFSHRYRMKFRWTFISIAAMFAAISCREMDIAGRFSGPDSWIQGHAIWHLLTAYSLLAGYFYLRSEAPVFESSTAALRGLHISMNASE